MTKFLKISFVVAVLGSGVSLPAMAQSAGDTEMRLNQMEDQMRQLVGQVEQLSFTVKQLQNQLAATRKTTGQADEPAVPQAQPPKKLLAPKPIQQTAEIAQAPIDAAPPAASQDSSSGLEQIEDVAADSSTAAPAPANQAPRKVATISGGLGTTKSAESGDGGFQGQVLVAPGGEPVADGSAAAPAAGTNGVENVALQEDDPQTVYRNANENLANWQYGAAQQGFTDFLAKYPTHSLAGSAQYWLGETYYKQGDFTTAAKNFLAAYQNYPKSRRAPDSLLKLGMSLGKMGAKDKACASFGAVGTEFPNAVDVKKRAQVEFRRAGC